MKKRILVVDDDPQMTELLTDFCDGLGYEVITHTDGPSVTAAAQAWKPDLITLDLEMPGKDGLDVLNELRADPATRHIPVIIISVMATEAGIPPDLVQGVFDKPIAFQKLLGRIGTVLSPA